MSDELDIERWLRHRVLGLLHAERVRPGDRLWSIRSLAAERGVDHRAVAEAYRSLERDGVVVIRPGSGVYVAGEGESSAVQTGGAQWIADIFLDGWVRRLPRVRTGELIAKCAVARLRCGCIESNEDHLIAIGAELEADFSLELVPLLVRPDAQPDSLPSEHLDEVDLIVSTVFHGRLAREVARRAGKACVVVRVNGDFTAELDRRLTRERIVAVIADPAFAERGRAYLSVTAHRERVRFVLVDELRNEGLDLEADSVVISRAARRRLGMEEYHFIPSPPTVISAESAAELYESIVRLILAMDGE